ncbi:GTPase domain-containing protein [uncultured Roseobacter sp.]|uniref:GTPase domain-containing protein n=1 Tax=uncultured Roseobacter sp. TaxID=114847 RepID=UPI00261236E7|nr:GTPase domain-containing protein [uncultured Roseobacter sp.]
MLDDASAPTVIARLERLLSQADLPPSVRAQAEDLRSRLRDGVRIFVLGPKNVGKSQICGAMLGQFEAKSQTAGSAGVCFTHSLYEGAAPLEDLHIQSLSVPLLESVTLVDMETPDEADAFAHSVARAIAVADIVLWCTETFGLDETKLWKNAPDYLKDHSFLVLTKADIPAAKGLLSERIGALQTIASEEFHSFFPTSTHHIRSMLNDGTDINGEALAASGVKALCEAVSRLAASGRHADLDRALLLLERHGVEDQTAALAAEKSHVKDQTPSKLNSYEGALDLIVAATPALTPARAGPDLADHVLRACSTLVEDLVELAAEQTQCDEAFETWRNDLYDASDKVVLMSLENDMRSAADAATVILQIKHDLQDRIAC